MNPELLDISEVADKADEYRKSGVPKGISTGWAKMDDNFSIVKGQLNVVSGYPSGGKSEWVENIMVNMIKKHKWKCMVYSPESYPADIQFTGLIQKIMNRPISMMTDSQFDEGTSYLMQYLKIMSAKNTYSLMDILNFAKQHEVDFICIDPWNELEHSQPKDISETKWIGICLQMCRMYARENNVSFWVVAHPKKPGQKNKDGMYDKPDLYDIEGSSHWRNKADNGFIVHREDLKKTEAIVYIEKIKVRYYGKPGEVELNFNPHTSTYT